MLRADLAAAGIPYCVEGTSGKEYADFHALRHTFVSAFSASGADTKTLQTRATLPPARRSACTRTRSAELVKAVGRLKVPGTVENPLASLDREQLEGITLGLLVLLGTKLNPAGNSAGQSSVALRVAPAFGFPGALGLVGETRSDVEWA